MISNTCPVSSLSVSRRRSAFRAAPHWRRGRANVGMVAGGARASVIAMYVVSSQGSEGVGQGRLGEEGISHHVAHQPSDRAEVDFLAPGRLQAQTLKDRDQGPCGGFGIGFWTELGGFLA